MSKISHKEPFQHYNITHWTHMEEMKWFSSGFLGVLTANCKQPWFWCVGSAG
jgi:hypothetical protein